MRGWRSISGLHKLVVPVCRRSGRLQRNCGTEQTRQIVAKRAAAHSAGIFACLLRAPYRTDAVTLSGASRG